MENHLADIYHVVTPVKKHVHLDWLLAWLATFLAPRVNIGQYARYPQRGADLRNVPQAEAFERQPRQAFTAPLEYESDQNRSSVPFLFLRNWK